MLLADEDATRPKIAMARWFGVPTVTGGGPFEIAVAQGRLAEYLDLCADLGISRVECGQDFADMPLSPDEVVAMARARDLEVQFELGRKHDGAFGGNVVERLIEQGGAGSTAALRTRQSDARFRAVHPTGRRGATGAFLGQGTGFVE